jgi:cell division protein FtsN
LHGNINPFKNFELIKEAGYATDSGYTDALTRIYNQFPLIAEYDTKALNSQATTQHLYFVQVGAYTIKSNADTMLNRVKKAGFDAFVKEADGYYKVQVGAYSVKSNATTQLAKVKDAGFDAFIAEGDI